MPASERPRERLQKLGPDALSVAELIAVVLGRGIRDESVIVTVQRLVEHFGDLRGVSTATVEQLTQVRGIGLAKACQIKAVFELAKRLASLPEGRKAIIKAPQDAVNQLAGKLNEEKREHFYALLLDTRGGLIKACEVSVGSLDASIVHPREVFREAMAASAASVVFAHNHPSGDCEPSTEDIQLTQRLVEVGELVGISVLDHIVIGGSSFTSMKRKGLM